MSWADHLEQLTTEEKVALVSGTDSMYTNPIPRLKIPSLSMADGPHGVRKQLDQKESKDEKTLSKPATAFPTAAAVASSWNPQNAEKIGAAMARECRFYGVQIQLGPGVNIKRNPLCGRNFEYYSEDPLLAGSMGAAQIRAEQEAGTAACVKHFAVNNGENYRFMGNNIVDKRALREIYLRAFEKIVKEAHPAAVMCAYNQINGTFCSENEKLLTEILRNEWGFKGLVMTDWGATKNRVKGMQAGVDLEMPGDTPICRRQLLDALAEGSLSMEELDRSVERVLELLDRWLPKGQSTKESQAFENPLPLDEQKKQRQDAPDWEEHHRLAGEIAADSAVLLKNDGSLPLTGQENLLIVGELFEKMRYQGAGSSMVNPKNLTTPKDAFDAREISYIYVKGYRESSKEPDADLIQEAVDESKKADCILLFAGLTDEVESEGMDRPHMSLPKNQLSLIDALIEEGKQIILVLFAGSVVELPFADQVSAILDLYLPGQNGGTAVYQLLYGEVNPSGRLAETWPYSYEDVPFGETFGKEPQDIYKESIYVGYRYYLTAGQEVRYPFGYGLSYTKFQYENLEVTQEGPSICVSCEVVNTGDRFGGTVVQLYVRAPRSEVFKPLRELRAFQKVYLESGQRQKVRMQVSLDDLRYYHQGQGRFILESGTYEWQICADAQTVLLAETLQIEGESVLSPYSSEVFAAYFLADTKNMTDAVFEEMSGMKIPPLPPRFPLTVESRFSDLQQTRVSRIVYRIVMWVLKKGMKKAQELPEGIEKDNGVKWIQFLEKTMNSNSLRAMSMSAGTMMPYNYAEALVELANRHYGTAVRVFFTKIQVPKLPKEESSNS